MANDWWIDGKKLRALREARGLSQGQLARRTGMVSATVSRIEMSTPSHQPWSPNLMTIASELGVEASDLVDGDFAAFQTDLAAAQGKGRT